MAKNGEIKSPKACYSPHGEKKYYLGILCRRSHNHNNTGMSMRDKCGHCLICRLIERRNREAKPGYKERQEILRKLRISKDPYYRERSRQRQVRQRELHRDTMREQQREYRRKERVEKPEETRLRARTYYQKNSTLIKLRNRLRRAFKDYSSRGKVRSADKYGIDYMAIILYLGDPPTKKDEWHIDHIRPLSSFDWDDPQQIITAFSPKNHQWLRARDNHIKYNKYVS